MLSQTEPNASHPASSNNMHHKALFAVHLQPGVWRELLKQHQQTDIFILKHHAHTASYYLNVADAHFRHISAHWAAEMHFM